MLPSGQIETAAGACGVQNSPPGAWETARFNRVEGCTLPELHYALYRRKTLLQAWSYRGVPVVFPTAESGIFLSPLAALKGEAPWIYTRGIALALEHLQMSFDSLLPLVKQAAGYLDAHTVQGKETLDRVLADAVREHLPSEKRTLWDAPSMYGAPDRQTVGGAAVSFLLRPCSFSGLVVFGCRLGGSPTFASFRSWLGRAPETPPDADRLLVRKFLHCHGPSTPALLAEWLGCSPAQARRLWNSVAQELEPVSVEGKARWLLSADRDALAHPCGPQERLLLLGPHDPYLDTRDRDVLLPDKALQKLVWRTVGNPGAVVLDGRISGVWTARTVRDRLAGVFGTAAKHAGNTRAGIRRVPRAFSFEIHTGGWMTPCVLRRIALAVRRRSGAMYDKKQPQAILSATRAVLTRGH